MKVLFIYPESYLNVGIPGGIAIMSALLKQRNHQVDIFDTAFLKTKVLVWNRGVLADPSDKWGS